ncbi:MAG: hypothetical protein WDM88_12180 [Galbitalea sp.]
MAVLMRAAEIGSALRWDVGDAVSLAADGEAAAGEDVFVARLDAVGVEGVAPRATGIPDQVGAFSGSELDERPLCRGHSIGQRLGSARRLFEAGR